MSEKPDWRVQLRQVTEETVNGLAVMLVDAAEDSDDAAAEIEVGRVAFVRSSSENPDADFQEALGKIVTKADQAAELMDECEGELSRAREMAEADLKVEQQRIVDDAKQKMREVVGLPPATKAKSKAKKKFE